MKTTAKTKHPPVVRPAHRKAVEALLDKVAGPFRRSTLSAVLYPLTSPRSRDAADALANAILRDMAKEGLIQRYGHLHWESVTQRRTLQSGRAVPELNTTVSLPLITRCPEKWVAIDLETGQVWAGSQKGQWTPASAEVADEALECLL